VGALLKKLSDARLEVFPLSRKFNVMVATPAATFKNDSLLGTAVVIIYSGVPVSHYHV